MPLRVPYGELPPPVAIVWRKYAAELGDELKPRHAAAFGAWCRAVVEHIQLAAAVDRFAQLEKSDDPETVKLGIDGKYKTGVLLAGAFKRVMHGASEFGLTIAAERRIGPPDDEGAPSAILEFLRDAS